MSASAHLSIFQYDDQSASEIVRKTDILIKSGGRPNIKSMLEYEQANQNRKEVVSHFKKLLQSDDVLVDTSGEATGNGKDKGEGSPDTHAQATGKGPAATASK